LLGELATTAIGAHIALIWVVEPVLVLLVAVPATVIARSFEHIHRLRTETRSAVRNLAEIVDHRDPTTYHHSERVSVNATRLAQALGLPSEQIELIEQAAAVHDLGKIGVPDRVLLKPGPLTVDEQETMRQHTALGSEILTRFELFRPGAEIVRHHHERWDGRGYPAGLAGDAIPLGARVVAVADAFDAMTSTRPYREALSVSEALRRIADGSGSQWDPRIVRIFLELMERTADRERTVVTNARRRQRVDDRKRGRQPRRPDQAAGRPERKTRQSTSGRKGVKA
jgi:putative nucleotidyltransferase with HDIG domain